MRLRGLQRTWDRLGRRDPFWAVFALPEKRGRKWLPNEFFRTGEEEVSALFEAAKRLGIPIRTRRALDFGCGAGRVTQALARSFELVDGVDIAPSMVALANRLNKHPDRCRFHVNDVPHLQVFPDGSFTFIYSVLVLQHMKPDYSKRYLGEFLRLLTPDGVLVFQLPSHRAPAEPPADARRSPSRGRLRKAACAARIAPSEPSLVLKPGQLVNVSVAVQNLSPEPWPSLPAAGGRWQVNLGNHWLSKDGQVFQVQDARCPLPHDLEPGEQADLLLGITAPRREGDYWLELDLVQEGAFWFQEAGSTPTRVPCHVVEGTGVGQSAREVWPMPSPPAPRPPLRERSPRLYSLLKALGASAAYGAARRGGDALKRRRDDLREWWRGRRGVMEMHCILRAEVTTFLAERGGRVVATDEASLPGGLQSYRYWVLRG